jgi:hypothetical protein
LLDCRRTDLIFVYDNHQCTTIRTLPPKAHAVGDVRPVSLSSNTPGLIRRFPTHTSKSFTVSQR